MKKEGVAHFKYDPNDRVFDGAEPVVRQELEYLQAWRGREPQVGLALSGGGIRSASFCLGALQALAHENCLPNIDYLSTVSGGGYIGASVSYLLHESAKDPDSRSDGAFDTSRDKFPYISYPMVGAATPSESNSNSESDREKGRLLRRLRQSASYLAPGNGVTFLSFAGVLLRNLVASAAVHVSVLAAFFLLLMYAGVLGKDPSTARGGVEWSELAKSAFVNSDSWNVLLTGAVALFALYLLLSIVYVVLTRCFNPVERWEHMPGDGSYAVRRLYDVGTTYILFGFLATLIVGAIPLIQQFLTHYQLLSLNEWVELLTGAGSGKPAAVGAVATVTGVLGNLWGFLQTRSSKKPSIPTSVVVTVASSVLLLGVLLLVYVLTRSLNRTGTNIACLWGVLIACLVFLGWMPNTNYVSLHRFYRDRLMELFLPDLRAIRSSVDASGDAGDDAGIGKSSPGNSTMLGDLCGAGNRRRANSDERFAQDPAASPDFSVQASYARWAAGEKKLRGPYHIINANVVLVASGHPRYRGRGGDSFILSPLFCGSRATGWEATTTAAGTGLTLATAMAISGAALSPNAAPGGDGFTRQPLLSVLMGLLNLRLGYWYLNPNPAQNRLARWTKRLLGKQPNMIWPALSESLDRSTLHEHSSHVLLTDGGHFENLGLYELVRRRLKLIVLCDATEDLDFKFVDLANAVEKVRADFGALIHITSEDLRTQFPVRSASEPENHAPPPLADRSYLIARIDYAGKADGKGGGATKGLLIYLKATLFNAMFADLHGYGRAHADFPDQSSGDQFFDERQFEAYRELGYQATWLMLKQLLKSKPNLGSEFENEARGLLFGHG